MARKSETWKTNSKRPSICKHPVVCTMVAPPSWMIAEVPHPKRRQCPRRKVKRKALKKIKVAALVSTSINNRSQMKASSHLWKQEPMIIRLERLQRTRIYHRAPRTSKNCSIVVKLLMKFSTKGRVRRSRPPEMQKRRKHWKRQKCRVSVTPWLAGSATWV